MPKGYICLITINSYHAKILCLHAFDILILKWALCIGKLKELYEKQTGMHVSSIKFAM